jgi:hypothetical protein
MFDVKARLKLLVRLVSTTSVTVEKMAPRAYHARCNLCKADAAGISETAARSSLNHGPDCAHEVARRTAKELEHAAA